MDQLAAVLARSLGQPVVNETRLDGLYQVSLDYAPVDARESLLPSIFTAVEDELGLALESRTVPVEMLVIDHIERPTPN
jgi:uncharacterized protein (TIGR03435 family)